MKNERELKELVYVVITVNLINVIISISNLDMARLGTSQ